MFHRLHAATELEEKELFFLIFLSKILLEVNRALPQNFLAYSTKTHKTSWLIPQIFDKAKRKLDFGKSHCCCCFQLVKQNRKVRNYQS